MGLTVRPVRIWMCSWHSVHASLHTQTCGFAVDRGLWLVSHGERFNNLHLLPQWLTRKTEKKKKKKKMTQKRVWIWRYKYNTKPKGNNIHAKSNHKKVHFFTAKQHIYCTCWCSVCCTVYFQRWEEHDIFLTWLRTVVHTWTEREAHRQADGY